MQPTGTNAPCIVRIVQPEFQYWCTKSPCGTSSYGYLTTNSQATTHILVSCRDELGPITKVTSISDTMLRKWIHEGIDGLSIGIDVQTDQTTIYSVAGSDRDAYLLCHKAVSGEQNSSPSPFFCH